MNYDIFKEYLSDDSIILEAGSCDGTNTIDLATVFPNGYVYGFEPVKYIFNGLKERVKDIKNISVYELALDDICGEKEMFISSGFSEQSSSLLKPKEHLDSFPTCYFNTTETVKTITINEFVTANNIPKIDLMWLDLQGNELKALSKAYKILPTVKAIYTEYSTKEFYEGLTLYSSFKEYMNKLGFKEVFNDTCNLHLGCGDSLFIRK